MDHRAFSNIDIFNDEWFNATELLALFDGDAEIVDAVIKSFLESTPDIIAKLELAILSNNIDAILNHSHMLKGCVGCIKSEILFSLICKIHDNTKNNNCNQFAINHIDDFKNDYKKLDRILSAYIKK